MFTKRRVLIVLTALVLVIAAAANAFASTYVGNAHTHKFHYEWCRYVDRMNDSNKIYFEDREDAIDQGYVPCKVCQP
jgi:hypothetical protein